MKYLYLILLLSTMHVIANGQDTVKRFSTSRMATRSLDTNMVVYDEDGKLLHYYQYTQLLNTGEYSLRQTSPPGTPNAKALLKKMSHEESMKMYELVKPMIAIKSPLLKEGAKLDITPLLASFTEQELNKKAIVLVFWYADCPPCTENFANLNSYFKQITNPEDLIIIAITRDGKAIAQAKLIQKPLLYAQLLSNAGQVNNYYQLNNFPSYVVADKDRTIRFAVSGSAYMTIPIFKSTISQILIQ